MAVLLTGGAGYIGSHTALILLNAGYEVVVVDNLSNASKQSLARVERLAGKPLTFIEGDVREIPTIKQLLVDCRIAGVIHFAGAKSVGESTTQPLAYYDNNVGGAVALCQAMDSAGVKTLVFSSSATVYGDAQEMPLAESAPTGRPANPYGRSKLMIEDILQDLHAADPSWRIARLRYFNPVGAHESGDIGEDPSDIPNNLLPYITQVAVGRRPVLSIFGDDYPTPDGTGVRDYIHVMDLADGHLKALEAIAKQPGLHTWNLGTGRGYSVLELVNTFERVTKRAVPYQVVARRQGDVARCWADPAKAHTELNWQCQRGLDDILRDAWRWQEKNPNGYRS
jgi:UDP-glucose 4-epimerase